MGKSSLLDSGVLRMANVRNAVRLLLARSMGIEIEPTKRFSVFSSLMRREVHRIGRSFRFVQIGANDGVFMDPIYQWVTNYRLRGLVVEPLPDYFEKLKRNYARFPLVIPVNIGIHATEKSRSLYRVNPAVKEAPVWAQGIASFDRNHLLRHGMLPEWLMEIVVPCVSLPELLEIHKVDRVDLLQLDTEGYDSEIVHMVDFKNHAPTIIRFEHGLSQGTMEKSRLADVVSLLHAQRYKVVVEEDDAIAWRS